MTPDEIINSLTKNIEDLTKEVNKITANIESEYQASIKKAEDTKTKNLAEIQNKRNDILKFQTALNALTGKPPVVAENSDTQGRKSKDWKGYATQLINKYNIDVNTVEKDEYISLFKKEYPNIEVKSATRNSVFYPITKMRTK